MEIFSGIYDLGKQIRQIAAIPYTYTVRRYTYIYIFPDGGLSESGSKRGTFNVICVGIP